MKHLNFLSNFRWFTTVILLITFGIGQIWGTETICKTLDFSDSDFRSGNGTTSQTTTWTATKSTTTWSIYGFHNNNWNSSWTKIRAGSKKSKAGDAAKTGTGTISTSFSCSEAITKVVVTTASCAATSDRKLTGTKIVLASNSTFTENVVEYTGPTTATSNEMTFTVTTPTANRYYKLSFTWYNNTTSTTEVIEVNKVEYYYQEASCSANPTIGTASLNGSFKLTSLTDAVSVSSGTCSPGSDCAWIDYGFAWSLGSTTTTPTVSNNKVQVGTSGTATSWATDASHKVQPSSGTTPTSWAVGSTYYVRTYGKNGKDAAEFNYGTAASFTLRSITFNSNGGSSVGPWYVNSGGTYSAPTAPTKTGYTFGGWYTDNSTFESAVDWTAAVSANKTYYAKWTASVYRITLDNESPTTSGSTYVDLTYNSSTHAGIINPKKTGYTFGGYWTADNGTGTMVINTSGVLQANVTNYTGAGGIWTKAATTTLYAKWTINNYTVTWKVNGEEWSGKGGTDNANYNTAWSALTLPTAPTTSDGCGQKFVGWTTTENYSNATTAPTDLLNADNKSGKTAVLITDDVVFHAVFADYDE